MYECVVLCVCVCVCVCPCMSFLYRPCQNGNYLFLLCRRASESVQFVRKHENENI